MKRHMFKQTATSKYVEQNIIQGKLCTEHLRTLCMKQAE